MISQQGFLWITDSGNNRLVKRKKDLSYISEIGTGEGGYGAGNDEFHTPHGLCTDGTYVYVADEGNSRIVKRRCDDMTFVAKVGSFGGGDDQFNTTTISLCTDGTYLYTFECGGYLKNNRITKRRCSDLSFVAKFGINSNDPTVGFNGSEGIATDGTYLYVGGTVGGGSLSKYLCSNLSHDRTNNDGYMEYGMALHGRYIWTMHRTNNKLRKRLCSDLSVVLEYGSGGAGDSQFNGSRGAMGCDGTYLYIADLMNYRIKKHLASDGSYVTQIGHSGNPIPPDGYDHFMTPWTAVVMAPDLSRSYGTIIG